MRGQRPAVRLPATPFPPGPRDTCLADRRAEGRTWDASGRPTVYTNCARGAQTPGSCGLCTLFSHWGDVWGGPHRHRGVRLRGLSAQRHRGTAERRARLLPGGERGRRWCRADLGLGLPPQPPQARLASSCCRRSSPASGLSSLTSHTPPTHPAARDTASTRAYPSTRARIARVHTNAYEKRRLRGEGPSFSTFARPGVAGQ